MTAVQPRVAIVSRAVYPLHGYGGLEKHVYYLASHLKRLGVEVEIFTSPPEYGASAKSEEERPSGLEDIPVHYASYSLLPLRPNSVAARITNYPLFVMQQGKDVMERVQRGRLNIIHAHGLSGFGCAWERRRSGARVPLITNPHGLEDFKARDFGRRAAYSYFRAMYKYGARMSDRTVATDEVLVPEIEHYLGMQRHKIAVLPNAVDVEECDLLADPETQAGLKSRFAFNGSGPVIVSAGRLEGNKGFDVAIRALSHAGRCLPSSWRWYIVGSGSQRNALEEEVRAAGLVENVVFTGNLSDRELHSLLELADLFVHPTLYEGSSIITLEAMAHSLPVVASRTGGIPDKVSNGVNGYLVDPGDAMELSARIVDCVSDLERARLMGRVGRERAEELFAWPEVVRRTIAVYEELLEPFD